MARAPSCVSCEQGHRGPAARYVAALCLHENIGKVPGDLTPLPDLLTAHPAHTVPSQSETTACHGWQVVHLAHPIEPSYGPARILTVWMSAQIRMDQQPWYDRRGAGPPNNTGSFAVAGCCSRGDVNRLCHVTATQLRAQLRNEELNTDQGRGNIPARHRQ